MTDPRDLDITLFGATGFTGALTAEYLARNAPPGLRWALAGRSRAKLETLRDRLGVDVELREASVDDPDSVRRLAESTRVLVTTVGPYIRYGDQVVAACAAAGTDYVDLTGEQEFVDRTYLRHHGTAERSGARLVHACGFDSVPHDLGALFTVQQLPADTAMAVHGYVSAGGTLSGGTFDTALTNFARARGFVSAHRQRLAEEPRPRGRRVRTAVGRPGYSREAGAWVLPFPSLDPQVVRHSAAALSAYGPDFTYSHYIAVRSPVTAAGMVAGVSGMFALAQLPPTRRLLLRLRPPGSGPSAEQRAAAWFRVRFVGTSGERRVVTEVSGGDPGYGETSKMLAESALSLAYDDLPATAGQVTTAVAMGDALRSRLERAGIRFEVLERD